VLLALHLCFRLQCVHHITQDKLIAFRVSAEWELERERYIGSYYENAQPAMLNLLAICIHCLINKHII
jgi:hypothetical protein